MPHLILEYSDNVLEKHTLTSLLLACHETLVRILPTDLASCKSRAYNVENFVVNKGEKESAFVHLHVKILAGRSPEVLKEAGKSLLALLQKHFSESFAQRNLSISVEVSELAPTYLKVNAPQ